MQVADPLISMAIGVPTRAPIYLYGKRRMQRVLFITALLAFAVGVFCYEKISDDQVRALVRDFPTEKYLDPSDKDGYLEPILKVRLPGTQNSTDVRNHFDSFFKGLKGDWKIDLDEFQEDTPIEKNVSFTNFIATRDPPGVDASKARRLVLAAHYDSKLEPEGFIGAIDSAVPCAIIMYIAQALDEAITKTFQKDKSKDLGIQIVLLDGEEAFKEWTDTDSIYGARHLAEKMEANVQSGPSRKTELDTIDAFVLLDLLGSPGPSIPSYFRNTDWMHRSLVDVEKRASKLGFTKTKHNDEHAYFPRPATFEYGGRIGDDHLPFLHRGVPVLHLIPLQFPEVWHDITDDAEHLDQGTIHDWAVILTTFTAEYLEVGKYMHAVESRRNNL